MAHQVQNFQMHAGDNRVLSVTVEDSTGGAVDLTGATIRWALAKTLHTAALISKSSTAGSSEIEVTGTTAGEIDIKIVPTDTKSTAQYLHGVYYHEAEVQDSLGNRSTIFEGYVTIHKILLSS
jgi:hypothetical protein